MKDRIRPLPDDLVQLVAAGETIDSPAAAVRELAENALDAGATRIAIDLWLDRSRIRVADNGCGMTLDDLQQAATAHSTSKIRDRADFDGVQTLGFRGEALHGLARLSNLEVCSRPRESASEEEAGWQVRYGQDGPPQDVNAIAMASGTIAVVDRLFGGWPLRRDSLPSLPQQYRAIQLTIQNLALCHPRVGWYVRRDDRDWLTLTPTATARSRLVQCLPQVSAVELVEIDDTDLTGVVGLPDRCHRRRPDWVRVAANGRVVRLPDLEKSILAAFHRTLPRDRYPVAFLHLQVSPSGIDWHRTPSKGDIYLRQLALWQERVSSAIESGLGFQSDGELHGGFRTGLRQVSQLLQAAEGKGVYSLSSSLGGERSSLEDSVGIRDEGSDPRASPPAPNVPWGLKAVAQLHRTYILAEAPDGIWLIEQHVAHERVLYEQLLDSWQLATLETPIVLEGLTEEARSRLESLGCDPEPFGDDLWAVRSVPALLQNCSEAAAILRDLARSDLSTAQATLACRSAIRNGQPLEPSEQQMLLDRWQQTRHPRTCPHGRPIYLPLSESSLSRFFKRRWLLQQ